MKTFASLESVAAQPPSDPRLETMILRYRLYIRDIVARLCPSNLGLERSEIEQTAVIRLWRIVQSEREVRDFESYMYRVVARITLDAIREVKARAEEQMDGRAVESLPERQVSPETEASRRWLVARVRTVIDTLPENRRQALQLHLQGFTSHEIGRLLGWSEPKARNLVYRGLHAVRAKLLESGIDDTY